MKLRIIVILVCIFLGFIWGYGGVCLSSTEASTLANIEAILNICANLTEIIGIKYGLGFIGAAILILFLKEGRAAASCFFSGLLCVVAGLATPGIINWLVAALRDAQLMSMFWMLAAVCASVALFAVVFFVAMLWWPVHVAKRRGKDDTNLITTLSALSILIPLTWPIAVFLAYKKPKQ